MKRSLSAQKISDERFSESLTLDQAYKVMEHFMRDYLSRGDTSVSDFLYAYAELQPDGWAADPAALEDFATAWQKVRSQPE